MTARLVLTYRDNTAEKSAVTFRGESIGELNIAAQTALQETLITATDALTLGTRYKNMRVSSEAIIGLSLPAKGVQREDKWRVMYTDDVTGKPYDIEIPCYDPSLLLDGTEFMDKTLAAYTNFKAAFEAYHLSPAENAVTLNDIMFITAK